MQNPQIQSADCILMCYAKGFDVAKGESINLLNF